MDDDVMIVGDDDGYGHVTTDALDLAIVVFDDDNDPPDDQDDNESGRPQRPRKTPPGLSGAATAQPPIDDAAGV